MAEQVKAESGVPAVIVNNAGAGRFLFIDETEPQELAAMTAVPYHAAFYVTRAFIEEMVARRFGRIVNITTPVAYMPWAGAIGYAGARWAVRGFTEALRADLHGTGVGVTIVVPGKVSSEYFAHNPGAEERIPRVAKLMRTLTPEQTAEAIAGAIEHDRGEVIIPPELRLLMLQARLLPGPTRWLIHRTGARRPAR
jgi:short-subunit dehydrogenase